jgi:DNA-binding MarR family transcriptional regulator
LGCSALFKELTITSLLDPMKQDPTYIKNQCLGFLMKKAFQCIVGQADDALQRFELTYAQFMVLDQLNTSGPTGLLNLAKELDLDPGALTRSIDRLELKGLIKRIRSEQDKRLSQIELTAKSLGLIDTIPSLLAQVMNQHLQGFERDDYERLIHSLNRLIKNSHDLKQPAKQPVEVGEAFTRQQKFTRQADHSL